MAVELRCPDCRAKLRLKAAPEAGTEVECPKCGTVFPAPEPEPEEDAPKKKKKSDEDGEKAEPEEKKDKKTKTKKGKGTGPDANAPRKRKAKKKETSKAALIGVICAGVLMILCMSGVLIWFFTRTSKAVEMFYYVPEDAQLAMGINIGHAQKYPEFYKNIAGLQAGTDFKTAGDIIGKASGSDMDGLVDYVVKAESAKNGWAIVYRTKAEYDGADLSKIPGAEKRTQEGKTYYSAPALLPNNQRGLVFSPTNRLVVVCPAGMENMAAFKKMLNGHGENKDKTLGVRMGALGNRITRGTFWQMYVFDTDMKTESAMPAPEPNSQTGGNESKAQKLKLFSDALSGTKGMGIKASLGSREVRFEIVVWHSDTEKPASFAKRMKESDLGKGDEGTPPQWFKDDTNGLGDRKVAAQLLSNISFGSSGELFYVRSSVETIDLQGSASGAMGKVTGQAPKQGGMGAAPGGPGPGGAGPVPKPRRRRFGRLRAQR